MLCAVFVGYMVWLCIVPHKYTHKAGHRSTKAANKGTHVFGYLILLLLLLSCHDMSSALRFVDVLASSPRDVVVILIGICFFAMRLCFAGSFDFACAAFAWVEDAEDPDVFMPGRWFIFLCI